MDEFKGNLTEQEARICAKYWGVKLDGNIDRRHDAQGELVGQNTLCVKYEIPELAKEEGLDEQELRRMLSKMGDRSYFRTERRTDLGRR